MIGGDDDDVTKIASSSNGLGVDGGAPLRGRDQAASPPVPRAPGDRPGAPPVASAPLLPAADTVVRVGPGPCYETTCTTASTTTLLPPPSYDDSVCAYTVHHHHRPPTSSLPPNDLPPGLEPHSTCRTSPGLELTRAQGSTTWAGPQSPRHKNLPPGQDVTAPARTASSTTTTRHPRRRCGPPTITDTTRRRRSQAAGATDCWCR